MGINNMLDRDFLSKYNEIFTNLLILANQELVKKGMKIEPSVIIDKIISPSRPFT